MCRRKKTPGEKHVRKKKSGCLLCQSQKLVLNWKRLRLYSGEVGGWDIISLTSSWTKVSTWAFKTHPAIMSSVTNGCRRKGPTQTSRVSAAGRATEDEDADQWHVFQDGEVQNGFAGGSTWSAKTFPSSISTSMKHQLSSETLLVADRTSKMFASKWVGGIKEQVKKNVQTVVFGEHCGGEVGWEVELHFSLKK